VQARPQCASCLRTQANIIRLAGKHGQLSIAGCCYEDQDGFGEADSSAVLTDTSAESRKSGDSGDLPPFHALRDHQNLSSGVKGVDQAAEVHIFYSDHALHASLVESDSARSVSTSISPETLKGLTEDRSGPRLQAGDEDMLWSVDWSAGWPETPRSSAPTNFFDATFGLVPDISTNTTASTSVMVAGPDPSLNVNAEPSYSPDRQCSHPNVDEEGLSSGQKSLADGPLPGWMLVPLNWPKNLPAPCRCYTFS
jgi:hypothetical protein